MNQMMKHTTGLLVVAAMANSICADNLSTFGAAQITAVGAGGSYAGITLTATDANNGSGGFVSYLDKYTEDGNTPVQLFDLNTTTGDWDVPVVFTPHIDHTTDFGPGGADGFNSTLTIVAGQASVATNVSLRVRKANDNEVFGYSTTPPVENSPGWYSVLSDVFELTGIASTGPAVNGKTPTDVFALEISYLDNNNADPEAYLEDYIYEHGYVKPWTEADIANAGELQIAFLTSSGIYSEDDLGNFGVGSTVVENYDGSWAAFATEYGVTDANLGDFLGSWGRDTVGNTTWGVFDHNTTFTVVPEPQGIALLGLGGLLLLRRRR